MIISNKWKIICLKERNFHLMYLVISWIFESLHCKHTLHRLVFHRLENFPPRIASILGVKKKWVRASVRPTEEWKVFNSTAIKVNTDPISTYSVLYSWIYLARLRKWYLGYCWPARTPFAPLIISYCHSCDTHSGMRQHYASPRPEFSNFHSSGTWPWKF